jgi:FdhD protein
MRTYYTWKAGHLREVKGEIVREQPLTIYVNGQRFITVLSTPRKLDALVVGYLWLEKVIASVSEI